MFLSGRGSTQPHDGRRDEGLALVGAHPAGPRTVVLRRPPGGDNDAMDPLMTIGDFARASRLTTKALRFYHESGLLTPASVDERSGYRRYAPEQVADAQIIRALRALDVPVDTISEVLTAGEVETRSALIARHLARMEAKLDETRSAVRSLRAMLEEPAPTVAITHRSVPETRVLAIRQTIDLRDLGDWFRGALSELADARSAPVPGRAGAYGGVWSSELFADERGSATVFVPVGADVVLPDPPGRSEIVRLPPVELAVATHRGTDDTVARVYAALGAYVTEHELGVDGPVRETYLEGFPGIDEVSVSEIGWPIFRISR